VDANLFETAETAETAETSNDELSQRSTISCHMIWRVKTSPTISLPETARRGFDQDFGHLGVRV
jgi:hypothetical protein